MARSGSSKTKIIRKLTKKADEILDWDNKKANPKHVRRMISATNQEKENQ